MVSIDLKFKKVQSVNLQGTEAISHDGRKDEILVREIW